MGFGQAIATGFRKYVTFRGYASRPEYWWWTLFTVLVSIGALILDATFVDATLDSTPISNLWSLAVLLPGLAVLVRRLRDGGYAWGWVFIGLVPLVGAIVLLVMVCQPTKPRFSAPIGYAAAQ